MVRYIPWGVYGRPPGLLEGPYGYIDHNLRILGLEIHQVTSYLLLYSPIVSCKLVEWYRDKGQMGWSYTASLHHAGSVRYNKV